MRILYVYTNGCAPAAEAVRKHAPGAIFIETPHIYDYNVIMAENWNSGEDLVVVEEDKVLHYGVIPSFNDCKHPWCVFAYTTFPQPYTRSITIGLGCTKFSAEVQQEFGPEEFLVDDSPEWGVCPDCNGKGCWRYLDSRIDKCLWKRGYSSHVHGWVEHLHKYPADWNETVGVTLEGYGEVDVTATIRKRSASLVAPDLPN